MNKIPLPNANGLQLNPVETGDILWLLFRVAFEQPTKADRDFAQSVLLRTASIYPEYGNYSGTPKSMIRPAITPLRHKKKR